MGLDDRLRAALRDGDEPGDAGPEPSAVRRRARSRVWRRRGGVSTIAAVLVVAVAVAAVQLRTGHPHREPAFPSPQGVLELPPDAELAVSRVPRAAAVSPDVPALVRANTQFAFDLYRELAKESPGQNLFVSPESISNALALVYAGARGNTATEIGRAMHFDALPGDRLHAAFNALAQELLAPRVSKDKGRTPLALEQSDSAWGQRGYPWVQAYLDTLARYYGAGLRLADFARDAEHERQRINAWVAQQTKQRIKELLPPGIIDDLTRLVLVNTITFDAQWRTPFLHQDTYAAPFTRLDGTKVNVDMMHIEHSETAALATTSDYTAGRLPYAGGASMLVIVPAPGKFAAVEASVGPALLTSIDAQLRPGAQVAFPRFDFHWHGSLNRPLQALGIHDAFAGDADFSGMTQTEALYLSGVEHDAVVHVDENGTRAAAATAGVIEATAGYVGPALVADRPFLYLVRDDATGAVLFMGRVLDPTVTS